MSVLSRELDSYQRAVDAFQRRMNSYNRKVDAYRSTVARDANGNMLVVDSAGRVQGVNADGKLVKGSLPSGTLADYGLTPLPDDPRFRLVRQGAPTEVKRETLNNVRKYQDSETGEEYYFTQVDDGDYGTRTVRLTPEWRLEKEIPGSYEDYGDGGGYGPTTYQFSRDVSTYIESPPEWTGEFTGKAPDPTAAQVRQASTPNWAQIEAGLIGEVMRGKGVRSGVPVYRPRNKT